MERLQSFGEAVATVSKDSESFLPVQCFELVHNQIVHFH